MGECTNRLKIIRKQNRYSQREVAAAVGISRERYSHYENGIRDIPTSVLIDLSKFYKCTTDELLGSWYYYSVIKGGNND